MESRVERAAAMFESGYNCAQSVFVTYADLLGIEDRELALKLSSPMGAGIGRMREVCGTVSAMALLTGLVMGNSDPENEAGKTAVYEKVRQLSDAFLAQQGSILCKDLLGILEREESAAPLARTKEYYSSRPCTKIVRCAAALVEQYLLDNKM